MALKKGRDLINQMVGFTLLGFVLLALLRILFIVRFGYAGLILDNIDAVWRLCFNAFRFDAQVLSYILIPVTSLIIVGLFVRSDRFFAVSQRIVTHYFAFVLTVVLLVSLADHQFYLNFRSHFNPVFFEFTNEEPLILMHSIWREHPVILMIAGSVIVYWMVILAGRRILAYQNSKSAGNSLYSLSLPFAFVLMLPLGIRGSLSTFPLRAEDVYISVSREVNDCVPNSVFMLKKAWSEKKKQFSIQSEEQILNEGGFYSIEDALACYYGADAEKYRNVPLDTVIFSRSTSHESEFRPNVVLIVVESWSNRLIDFQPEMDLLCSMDRHLKEDILFRNFQSSCNGTIEAVESFTVSSPFHPLFTSKYRNISYPTAITLPFKENGYNAEFISGIELSWRNLSEVLPRQNFDKVTGKFELLKEMPDAECNNTWGVYDHSMLNFVADKLSNQKSPNFFMCLTSTSHTPFEFPDGYELPGLEVTPSMMKNFEGDAKTVHDYLRGYQYSNKALGDFMSRIKSDKELAENTVVIITGDHNIRMILPYNTVESHKYQFSVPLYIYLPSKLREQVSADTSKVGSHIDIIPTIVPLLLGNTRYLNMGQNLFDNSKDAGLSYSVNVRQVLHGNILTDEEAERKAKARVAILKYYFQQLFNSKQ
jgi:phosphoglycerol transferase MdoB-like AlkP superfamily enzyme